MQAWLRARASQQQTETVAPADAELLLMSEGKKKEERLMWKYLSWKWSSGLLLSETKCKIHQLPGLGQGLLRSSPQPKLGVSVFNKAFIYYQWFIMEHNCFWTAVSVQYPRFQMYSFVIFQFNAVLYFHLIWLSNPTFFVH